MNNLSKRIAISFAIIVIAIIVGLFAFSKWGDSHRQNLDDELDKSIKRMQELQGK